MARVEIAIEKVGDRWIGEVIGQRGGRRIIDRDAVDSLDAVLSWARASVAEVDPDEAERVAAPLKRRAAPQPVAPDV